MKSLVGSLVKISVKTRRFLERGEKGGGGKISGGVRVWGEDGELVGGENELKGIWNCYFEQLVNNEAEREAVVTSTDIEAGRGRVPMQRKIGRLEIERAAARLKCGKAAGMDGITAEMLKYGSDTVVEWM